MTAAISELMSITSDREGVQAELGPLRQLVQDFDEATRHRYGPLSVRDLDRDLSSGARITSHSVGG